MCRYFTLEISRKLLVTQAMETTTGANNAIFILAIYATEFFEVKPDDSEWFWMILGDSGSFWLKLNDVENVCN